MNRNESINKNTLEGPADLASIERPDNNQHVEATLDGKIEKARNREQIDEDCLNAKNTEQQTSRPKEDKTNGSPLAVEFPDASGKQVDEHFSQTGTDKGQNKGL